MRRLVAIVVLLLMVLAQPPAARAEPMISTLDGVVKGSTNVVIARFVAPPAASLASATTYELVVERALRGAALPRMTIRVKASPEGHAYFPNGTRLVAFIDASGAWTASATLAAGPSLEDGVLRVAGFYDFNAHLVTPGVLTLDQLEAYVTKGTRPAWTFRGKILLATPSGLSPSTFEVTAQAPSNVVTGMPPVAGFPAPTVEVGAWQGTDVTVTWDRNLTRPLQLEGEAVGKNADGSIAVLYRTSYPGLLTEAELRRYVADPKLGHPYYELRVELAGGSSLPLVLDKEIGRIGTLGTMDIGETSLAPGRYIKAGAVTVALAPATHKALSRGTSNGLVEELMSGPVACTYAGATPCTVRYVGTKLTALP